MVEEPAAVWASYGLSDLFFGYSNQSTDVFRYGTFFYIMAAEKHLKAVLIRRSRSTYEGISDLMEQYRVAQKIAKSYSHDFERMIANVEGIYRDEFGRELLSNSRIHHDKSLLIKSLYEGYMETRYPTVDSTSRHFPVSKGMYAAPIGSSFFTDFAQQICFDCWKCLVSMGVDMQEVVDSFDRKHHKNESYERFRSGYVATLPLQLQ